MLRPCRSDRPGSAAATSRPIPAFHIATAGWQLRAAHRDALGRGTSVLADYARVCNAVEVDSTFYRVPRRGTFERWASEVPPGFRFALKLPRAITQQARLRDCAGLVEDFLQSATGLGERLAVLLAQLPPSLALEVDVADAFFAALRERAPRSVAIVCEPRHASWCTPAAEDLWNRHAVARVAADPPVITCGAQPGAGPIAYWRWHGSPVIYRSAYGPERVQALADALQADGRSTWVVFDNTAEGHAIDDAQALMRALAGAPHPPHVERGR